MTEVESGVRDVGLLDCRFRTEVIELWIESSLLDDRVDVETRDVLVHREMLDDRVYVETRDELVLRGMLDDSAPTAGATEVSKLSSKVQNRRLYIFEKNSV